MKLSRREWLRGVGAGVLLAFSPSRRVAAQDRLQRVITDAVGARNIGVDVGRFVRGEGDTVRELYRVGVNQQALRPTASCFKAWLPLYYYNFTPYEQWDDAEGSLPYSVTVHSNNVSTGRLMQQVGELQSFGNAIEKYNDFLLYGMRLEHGINSWNWPTNPLIGISDERFASGGERVVSSGGQTFTIGNITTAADTLNGYRELFRRTFAQTDTYTANPYRRQAALRSLRLLSIPGVPEYNSPIERVVGRGAYMGKDGVLPDDGSGLGRVVNDAGLIAMGEGFIGVSFFSVRESEFSAIEILREIIQAAFREEENVRL